MPDMMTNRTETGTIDQHLDAKAALQAERLNSLGGSLFGQIDGEGKAQTLRLFTQSRQRLLRASTANNRITFLRKLARYFSADAGRSPRY